MGAISAAVSATSRSNCAPSSVASADQPASAASHAVPLGAKGRPFAYSKVVWSGAIMPLRAPASIDMLQSVSRPSMDSARIADPANSMAWPVAPSALMRAIMASAMSLAATPGASVPSTVMRMRFGLRCHSVCVISTWATSEAPMPKA